MTASSPTPSLAEPRSDPAHQRTLPNRPSPPGSPADVRRPPASRWLARIDRCFDKSNRHFARGRQRAGERGGLARAAQGPRCAALLGLVVLAVGCNRPPEEPFVRVPVAGQLTVDGLPLDAGQVRFIPLGETPGPKVTLEVRDGSFASPPRGGPAAGRHRFEVSLAEDPEWLPDDEQRYTQLHSQRGARGSRPPRPPRQLSVSDREVELSVRPAEAGPQRFDHDLTSRSR